MLGIVFLDTFYQPVLDALPKDKESRAKSMKELMFGTANFFSEAFYSYGWAAWDVVANDRVRYPTREAVINYVLDLDPDVIYCQDLSYLTPAEHSILRAKGISIVAQHSCPWAGDEVIKRYDVVFTSFPHYIQRISNVGVRAEFLQIGFGGKSVLKTLPLCPEWPINPFRPLNVSFVGGVGKNGSGGHWTRGMDLLYTIADYFPKDFKWWGYGLENVDKNTNLYKAYQGEAWGKKMYEIYTTSKIVLNRHGEVAGGYANNMRLFEATGCGALLMTEAAPNLDRFFDPTLQCVPYESVDDCIRKICAMLTNERLRSAIAEGGWRRTMESHCYSKILEPVCGLLTMECNRKGKQ